MEHGTVEMYRKELRVQKKGGSAPCEDCMAAQAKYIAEYRAAKPPRDRRDETVAATVKRRALNRLAAAHSAEFQALCADERSRV